MTLPDLDAYARLARQAPPAGDLPARLAACCGALAGAPYQADPLGGGPGQPERLHLDLTRFDCVTFVETVAAFCVTDSPAAFAERVRGWRYRGGQVDWRARRHYMAEWVADHLVSGWLNPPADTGLLARVWTKRVSVIPALGERQVTIRGCLPTRLRRSWRTLRTGDAILFGSTRADLDYFHLGLLVRRGPVVGLAHASRSRGEVVVEPLRRFLQTNQLSGLTVVSVADGGIWTGARAPGGGYG